MYQLPFMRKWFTSLVFPGEEEVMASLRALQSMFIREDLPTFDRPMKAISGSFCLGFPPTSVLLLTNVASVIFIP